MIKCKITVLKKNLFKEISEEYVVNEQKPYKPCETFKVGQVFITDVFSGIPTGFCTWAWNDIYKVLIGFIADGNFGMWYQDKNTSITCCTDGIRPVVFKIEKIIE